MSISGEGGFAQGRSSNRPPLFKGDNFVHWRSLMQMFIIDQDMELWHTVKNGPNVFTMLDTDGKLIEKPEKDYTSNDLEKASKNFKAMN